MDVHLGYSGASKLVLVKKIGFMEIIKHIGNWQQTAMVPEEKSQSRQVWYMVAEVIL